MRFMIQQEAYGLATRARGGQQHQRYLPVVVLDAIHVPGVDSSLQTTRTVAEIAGVTFVTIQDSDSDAVIIRQRSVALQSVVDVVNPLPQSRGIHQGVHSPEDPAASIRAFTLPRLSALHTDSPNQSRKKREWAVSSKALR